MDQMRNTCTVMTVLGPDFVSSGIQIVAPVEFDQSYSCYIWDLSAMDCHVLDPVMMKKCEEKAEDHHAWPMKFLTAALMKCVKAFFQGWRLPEGEWFNTVSTDFGQRCRP